MFFLLFLDTSIGLLFDPVQEQLELCKISINRYQEDLNKYLYLIDLQVNIHFVFVFVFIQMCKPLPLAIQMMLILNNYPISNNYPNCKRIEMNGCSSVCYRKMLR